MVIRLPPGSYGKRRRGHLFGMRTVARSRLQGCDGFRVNAPRGLIGWVEETWLGPDDEPAGLALRLLDGRGGFVLAENVRAVVPESEEIVLVDGASILELAPPRLERTVESDEPIAAAWTTTGELLAPPQAPGPVREALLRHRRWRLAPPPATPGEAPPWQAIAGLLMVVAFLVVFEIALAFTVARLVTGHAY
jgi:hypothetical protein